jgi:hypothetical protein
MSVADAVIATPLLLLLRLTPLLLLTLLGLAMLLFATLLVASLAESGQR